jgi:enamine deaminase RidA (YjgF/YER057c/UK114 family)
MTLISGGHHAGAPEAAGIGPVRSHRTDHANRRETVQEHFTRPAGLPPVNGYSHAVAFSGRLVAVSGQVPLTAQGELAGEDAETQVRQVFENLRTALIAAGSGPDRIVKLTVYLTDLADLATFRTVRDEFLTADRLPACSLVQVSALVHPLFRVEVDAFATA